MIDQKGQGRCRQDLDKSVLGIQSLRIIPSPSKGIVTGCLLCGLDAFDRLAVKVKL